jgi:lysophospholipase L1-like esterase
MFNVIYRRIIFYTLVLSLLGFNVYYFFVQRSVGPTYYIEGVIHGPKDNTTELAIYKALSQEYSYMNTQYRNKSAIVFLGDSITKRFNTSEFFRAKLILNRGIFFDTTEGVLRRLNHNVNNLSVRKLFLMIGYNDLKYRSNGEILENISDILSRIKSQKIFVQSLLPVAAQRKNINARIVQINTNLKALCSEKGVFYVDLHSMFRDNSGGMAEKYSLDGVHPNILGYELWSQIIFPLLM